MRNLRNEAYQLGYGFVKNHPFVDGNKRTGAHIMPLFLAVNGYALEYDDEEFIELILSVAAGDLDDSDLEKWINEHIV